MWGFDLNTVFRDKFLIMIFLLLALGAILKHRTNLNNKVIPAILFAVSFPILAFWGYLTSEYADTLTRTIDALFWCGLGQGLTVAAFASYGWDTIRGLWMWGIDFKAKKKLFKKSQKPKEVF